MANQPFTTPEGRLVWSPGLWTAEAPQQNPQGAKKFSCSLAIPLSDPGLPKLIAEYNAVVINELGAAPPTQEGGLAILPRNCNDPCLEFGAIVHPDQPEAAGVILLKVGRREEDGAPKVYLDSRTPCVNKADIYSGCWGYFHAKFWTYNSKFHGVSCDLYAFLKSRDDAPTGRIDPDSSAAFAGIQGVGVSTAPVGTPAPANFAIPGVQPLPVQPAQPVQPVQPAQPAQQYAQPVQPAAAAADPYDHVPF